MSKHGKQPLLTLCRYLKHQTEFKIESVNGRIYYVEQNSQLYYNFIDVFSDALRYRWANNH